MEALVYHLVKPIVSHPEDVSVQTVEGSSVVELELVVHEDDRDTLEGDSNRTLRSLRAIVSAAAGRRKATVTLVDEHGVGDDEE